jgi:hypothetical protein
VAKSSEGGFRRLNAEGFSMLPEEENGEDWGQFAEVIDGKMVMELIVLLIGRIIPQNQLG